MVKIDPQHVGVGLYQHDVNPKHLRESLDGVIESCVNAALEAIVRVPEIKREAVSALARAGNVSSTPRPVA